MSINCYLISPRGFCSGVNRAVKMVEQIIKLYKKVYIIEDIIHNKIFMQKLLDNGIMKVDSINDVPEGGVVMFSAHGVSEELFHIAEQKNITIIDGTCPVVKSIQKSIKNSAEQGKVIIIIGHRSHPEVIGLLGHTLKSRAYVVYNEMDIDLLPDLSDKKVVYYTQTTLDRYSINNVIESLKRKIPHIESESKDNICYATKDRQEAVKNISSNIDLLLVVGSLYSSNTCRLKEVGIEHGIERVYQIENTSDIDLKWFDNIKSFGITSGASAPEYIFEEIVSYLRKNLDIITIDYQGQN